MRLISKLASRVTLLYFGCAVLAFLPITVSALPSSSLPSWFTNVESDPKLVSDVGVGETLELARQDALSNIAKSLHSQVSATTEIYIATSGNTPKQTDLAVNNTSSHTQVSTEEIALSMITWTHSKQVEDIYYVRGQMKLAEWVAVNQNRLSAYLDQVEKIISKPNWKLVDYRNSLALDTKLIQDLASMLAPYSLSSNHTRQVMGALNNKQRDYTRQQCFSVKKSRDKVTDKYFLPIVEGAVHRSGLLVSDDERCEVISVIARNDNIAAKQIRTTLLIQLANYESYQMQVVGEGLSYKARLISAANNLSVMLEKQGGILP
ncbi:hypothetical protein VII00023_00280 [Vibrio ichthyoenteri ATCC 700023]|uniref:LPP20 lipoprotein n=1 Tax=Vibrio ichthyoenteri ATCC 700023 TaxID=870968 RepID=F9RX13_9VIBR|nr:LPP20 family lipoprotein [Vibrio ichthyoenteri]EGU48586.1 hypothetical protein VII00023_00280 [Vibrio ichthyoenteri ATCC 700023]